MGEVGSAGGAGEVHRRQRWAGLEPKKAGKPLRGEEEGAGQCGHPGRPDRGSVYHGHRQQSPVCLRGDSRLPFGMRCTLSTVSSRSSQRGGPIESPQTLNQEPQAGLPPSVKAIETGVAHRQHRNVKNAAPGRQQKGQLFREDTQGGCAPSCSKSVETVTSGEANLLPLCACPQVSTEG